MPHPPREGDLTIDEAAREIISLKNIDATVFLKWTCPSCGERVVLDKALYYNRDGALVVPMALLHTEKDDGTLCMVSVPIREARVGFTVIITTPGAPEPC